jgi:5-methylcytosine-specific restriction endonuclease McrA
VKIDIPVEIDPERLGQDVSKLPSHERHTFIFWFLDELDADTYHIVAQFLNKYPDNSVECPRCKRHTYKHRPDLKCTYCQAVLP